MIIAQISTVFFIVSRYCTNRDSIIVRKSIICTNEAGKAVFQRERRQQTGKPGKSKKGRVTAEIHLCGRTDIRLVISAA